MLQCIMLNNLSSKDKPLLLILCLCVRCEPGKIQKTLLPVGMDEFFFEKNKGTCADAEFMSHQKVLVFEASSFGHDAWFMEFAIVYFEDMSYFNCMPKRCR